MGLQRVRHDLATQQQQLIFKVSFIFFKYSDFCKCFCKSCILHNKSFFQSQNFKNYYSLAALQCKNFFKKFTFVFNTLS